MNNININDEMDLAVELAEEFNLKNGYTREDLDILNKIEEMKKEEKKVFNR